MNFLAHLYLADDSDDSLIGNFLGDFVKGSIGDLREQHPPAVAEGLIRHRRVDAFTDAHPEFLALKRLVSAPRRRFAGILIDVYWDHFLARDWAEWAERVAWADSSLDAFTARVYRAFLGNLDRFPEGAAPIVQRMADQDWLGSYRTLEGIGSVLDRMAAHRVRRGGALTGSVEELSENFAAFETGFRRFFPDLMRFVREEGAGPPA